MSKNIETNIAKQGHDTRTEVELINPNSIGALKKGRMGKYISIKSI